MNLSNIDWQSFLLTFIILAPVGWYFFGWLTAASIQVNEQSFILKEANSGIEIYKGSLLEIEKYLYTYYRDYRMCVEHSSGYGRCGTVMHNNKETHYIIGVK